MARAARESNSAQDFDQQLALWRAQRHGAAADYRRVLGERENDLLALSEAQGPRSVALQTIKRQAHDAEMQFGQIQQVVRRPLNKHVIRFRYFAAFALALALLEAPVNKYLFDVALQGSNIVSYSISIAVAFFLLTMAHLAGRCLRQVWSEYRRRVVWSNLFLFLFCMVVIGGVISILTVGRASTSAEAAMSGFGGIFGAVGQQFQTHGLLGALSHAFSDISALILATVNLGGVFVALLLAYFSHDPDRDFDNAAIAREHKLTLLEKMNATYLKRRRKLIEHFKPFLTGISANHGAASKAVVELKSRAGMPMDEQDSVVIDELDGLAEDSDHAEEAGVIEPSRPASDPKLHELPRRVS